MKELNEAEALLRQGQFAEAMRALSSPVIRADERVRADVLRGQLLERIGEYDQSQAICEKLLRTTSITDVQKSICEMTLGIIKHDTADTERGLVHLQKAISLGKRSNALEQTCWSQLRLMLYIANRSGPQSLVQTLAEIRRNAVKLGDPIVSSALHIFVGEMEARRGLLESASRHTVLGLKLLGTTPNVWLEARAEITLVAVAIMRSDIPASAKHASNALNLAKRCGSAGLMRACLANLGNVHYLMGEFEIAIEHLKAANAALPKPGQLSSGVLESLARVALVRNRLGEASEYLDRIESTVAHKEDSFQYVNRHARLTRAELQIREGAYDLGLRDVAHTLELAQQVGDELLRTKALLVKTETLRRLNQCSDAQAELCLVYARSGSLSPDIHAQSERELGCLQEVSNEVTGRFHVERARRIYRGLHNVPGLLELERSWNEAVQQSATKPPRTDLAPDADARAHAAGNILQDIAALMLHVGRPELLATDLVAVLAGSGAVLSAAAVARGEQGAPEILASFGDADLCDSPAAAEKTLSVGSARNCAFEVILRPRADLESMAVVNAVGVLLATVCDLERARAEREERLTLWPIDEVPIEDDEAVIAGEMRRLMTFARKIATTTVTVLITGESGTGKEILARALHRYSARNDKPFVPFNAAAIPREMLESQLFGHRRGAFTGADRDSPGLIRAAKDGTLFLDEIGELGLDLQPKLLRFLESGEINPLGEPTPFKVDVRIIAATNSNLEELVQQGRFREDLYYRLNVFPLWIPPLRERRDEIELLVHYFVNRAASEFGKGRLRVAEETMEHLLLFPWPGNVRQLNNELRRSVALAEPDSVLAPSTLSLQILRATQKAAVRSSGGPELAVPLHDKLMPTLSRIEREMIRVALSSNHGRAEAAAKALGISRKGLYLKRQRLGL